MNTSHYIFRKLTELDSSIRVISQFTTVSITAGVDPRKVKTLRLLNLADLQKVTDIILKRISKCQVCTADICTPHNVVSSFLHTYDSDDYFKYNTFTIEYIGELETSQTYNLVVKSIMKDDVIAMTRVVVCY